MFSSDKKLANAVGAKSARACDNCIRKRARWYCAADDAFLCQSCDSSVHSANPLARRHERVRLKTASFKSSDDEKSISGLKISVATWHQGFTRKARTPRQKKQAAARLNPIHLVPEIYSEENSHEENEEQLLYREIHNLHNFLPSEMDLAEFAADVESLLGKGLEDETFDMEGLGILDCDDEKGKGLVIRERVKNEIEEVVNHIHHQVVDGEFIDLGRETFELNFDYDSPIAGEELEDNKAGNVGTIAMMNNYDDSNNKVFDSKKIFLRLDYEGVLSAWDDQKSPWTTGERPDLDSDECWPDCLVRGTCGTMHVYGEMGMMSAHAAAMADGGREARVSRYREKRRTRLFSKKIRYEVRKLNAEKRPRMKGRFVKRSNFVAPSNFSLLNK
ncbi:hypothetical protein DH2020_011918 [Rehmannia glutinosa]|uniref:CONSTANS-like protein n=1 Tax=Rehmannia glutinosa TaxID=99300 RepID=A0ABR0XEY5_REHGL